MMSATLHDRIRAARLVPVIKLDRAEDAVPLAEALVSGGLAVAEVTPFAPLLRRSRFMRSESGFLGSCRSGDDPQDRGRAKGDRRRSLLPRFAGVQSKIVEFSLEKRIPIVPGVATPSEIEAGLSYSLEVLKLFPAEVIGGVGF